MNYKIFLPLVFSIFLLSIVSATVITDGYFQNDIYQTSATINNGGSIIVHAIFTSTDTITKKEITLPSGLTSDTGTCTLSPSGHTYNCTYSITASNTGTYTIQIIGTDSTGSTDNTELTLTVNTLPTPANHTPVINSIGDKTIDENSSLQFTISATDMDNNILTFSASNLPSGASFNQSSKQFSWTPTFSQSGSYQVTFDVSDGNGGTDSETITITVNDVTPVTPVLDTTAPTITLNSPANNAITNNTLITFNATANDNIGIANVSLYLNGILNQTNSSGLNNTDYIFPITLSNGDYTWYIKAYDTSGNPVSSSIRNLTVNTSASDTTPPQIQFGSSTPANNSNLSQNYIPVSVTASDSSGIQNIIVHLYNSNNVLIDTQTSATSSFSLSFTNLASGTYFINATATDGIGNINSTETRKIILSSNDNSGSSSKTGNTVYAYNDVYEQQYEAQLNQTNPQIDLGGQQTPAKTAGATIFLIITAILILGIGAAIFVLIRKR